jgi:Flp pilus assembly protein TadG
MLDRSAGRGPRGQVLALFALSLVCLLGLAALAIDLGFWRYEQRMQQSAADSAAIAAVHQLGYSSTPSSVTAAARLDAAANGFADNGTTVNVTANNPPLTGSYTANNTAVEVIVQKAQPVFFAGIFAKHSQSVSARAVAARLGATRNCMYALDPNGQGISFNSSSVIAPLCGIVSNAGYTNNQSTVNASSIGYHPGSTVNDSGTYPGAKPLPAVQAVDPCPTIPGCAYLLANTPATSPCAPTTTFQNHGAVYLNPGTYCAQVMFNNGSTVTFNPGLYYFRYGVTNNNATSITGTGVTIYSGGSIILSNSINLTAPATGNYAGVLFFQPGSGQYIVNNGSGKTTYAGLLYFPKSSVIIDGAMSQWLYVVASSIILNSNTTINVPSSNFPGSIGSATLVE